MAAIVLNNSGLRKGHCSPAPSRSQWQIGGYTGDMVVVSPPTGGFNDHRYTAKSFCKLWEQILAFVKSAERLPLYTLDKLHARTIPN
ncbi:hypothetical protein [Loktanella salsilacus]|uniref:hypothetical protein n=1 Tax=Loktanella salsilacus TaxID=195913 RepID=UPI0020B885ED|nr:hypothetical protein [Loktanella salsilacus]UTH45630.1 hypothetical protein KBK07_06225 [Loktanella salsilacus]